MSESALGWHFTSGNVLRDGRPVPPAGEWLVHEGPVKICETGLHYSERLIDALGYAPGLRLHRVCVEGVVLRQFDKAVCRRRRVEWSCDIDIWAVAEFAEACATRAVAWAREAATWATRAWAAETQWQEETLQLWVECCRTGGRSL